MAKQSAGILMFRWKQKELELLLVHPGGPFWAKKDEGSWSVPKGLYEDHEDPLGAAKREFQEETGFNTEGEFLELGPFKQPSGKTIAVWAVEGECDPAKLSSNRFSMEWPPKSGRIQEFPEADRAGWFGPMEAIRKLTKGQVPIVHALLDKLHVSASLSKNQSSSKFDAKGQGSLF